MVYHAKFSLFSLLWLLSYLCTSVCAAPLRVPVLAVPPTSPPSESYFTPTHPISRRDSPSSLSRRAMIQNFLRKRELIITMLNGEPVESHFVNLLDLWHMAEKAIANTPEGTPRHAELVDFQETKATELTRLMQGIAILQSVVPPEPTSTSQPAEQTIQVEGTISADVTIDAAPTGTSSSTVSPSETSRAEPTPEPAPTSTSPTAPTQTPQTTSSTEAPGASAPSEPVPTVAQAPPVPAPQPSSPAPGSAATGQQNGNPGGGNARDPATGTPATPVSGTVTRSSGLNTAEAAQATGDNTDLNGGATVFARLPSLAWLVLGGLVVAGMA